MVAQHEAWMMRDEWSHLTRLQVERLLLAGRGLADVALPSVRQLADIGLACRRQDLACLEAGRRLRRLVGELLPLGGLHGPSLSPRTPSRLRIA